MQQYAGLTEATPRRGWIALTTRLLALGLLLGLLGCDSSTTTSVLTVADKRGGKPPSEDLPPSGPIPAFPGAEGWGALTLSECRSKPVEVLFVTNLNDGGAGSLRDAVGQSRSDRFSVIVFRTGGTITLIQRIFIRSSCLYIAGQTAPGDGIQLRNPEGAGYSILKIPAKGGGHDIVIRYLRIRSGRGEPGSSDNIGIDGGYNFVLDHLSLQWSNDEQIGFWTPTDVALYNLSLQRSMIAEALRSHSTALLLGGGTESYQISLHHNLFAHNAHRNPHIKSAKNIQFVGNVVYNWHSRVGRTVYDAEVDIIGNYFLAGPWSNPNKVWEHEWLEEPLDPSIYISGNIADPKQVDPNADNRNLVRYAGDRTGPLPSSAFRTTPLPSADVPITISPATGVLGSVLGDVGANARLDCAGNWVSATDPIDADVLRDVRNRTGPATADEVDHQDDFGGYPTLAEGTACTDSDQDGMPDAFETKYGLDPDDPSDAAADADGDGYINLEEYLNGSPAR